MGKTKIFSLVLEDIVWWSNIVVDCRYLCIECI